MTRLQVSLSLGKLVGLICDWYSSTKLSCVLQPSFFDSTLEVSVQVSFWIEYQMSWYIKCSNLHEKKHYGWALNLSPVVRNEFFRLNLSPRVGFGVIILDHNNI